MRDGGNPLKSKKNNDIPRIAWIFIWCGLIALGFAILSPILLAPSLVSMFPELPVIGDTLFKASKPSIGELGTAGDFLGGTTVPFLTIASVLFLVSTIFIQRSQLKLQHEELIETQNIFRSQSFENTFFNMINLHNQIVQSISYVDTGTDRIHSVEFKGRDYFEFATNDLISHFHDVEGNIKLEEIIQEYKSFYEKHQAYIGHYFRNLYHIVKLVHDNTSLEKYDDKMQYMRIIRAQLSSYELVLLLYNVLFNAEHWKERNFLNYINEYNLLHNMEKKLLIQPEHYNLLRPLNAEEPTEEIFNALKSN